MKRDTLQPNEAESYFDGIWSSSREAERQANWKSDKPFANLDTDPYVSICWDCGWRWKKGTDGNHSCVDNLKIQARLLAEKLEQMNA